MMRFLLYILLYLVSFSCFSQLRFIPYQDTPITHPDEVQKAFPWAGGLNGVQYGKIDIDNDGVADLAGYDRSTGRVLCFLRKDDTYQYMPQYEHIFPGEIQNFFILQDYDGDGRADLFTAGNLGITVYRNRRVGNQISWERMVDFIRYQSSSGNEVNLQVNFNDYPYIGDIDRDGDVDIMNFSFSGIQSRVQFYENHSIEQNGRADIGPFKLVNNYWGQVEDCDCGVFAFDNQDCQDAFSRLMQNARHAGGKSVAIHDFREDGKLELVSSHEECTELYYFNNEAMEGQSPIFDSFTSNFPNALNPAKFNFYPNTMILDVSCDDKKELLVSPNIEGTFGSPVDFASSNWLYKRSGDEYLLVTKEFLQEDMIDWGSQAVPSFHDQDNDGDFDLFLSYTDLTEQGVLVSAIAFYENIGGNGIPAFKLVTKDYLSLSDEGLANMFIQWVDVDLDGRKDLVLQASLDNDNQVRILFQGDNGIDLNSAFLVEDVAIGFGYSVHFADVTADRQLDLLVGKSSGGLILYENVGEARVPRFQKSSESYLGIGDDFFRSALRVFVSDIDNDGAQDLVTSDLSGNIRVFSNLESNTGEFDSLEVYNSLEQSFDNTYFGKRNSITFAPIFDDDFPTLVIGTASGGLRLFRNSEEYSLQIGTDFLFQVYPNPNSSRQLRIKTNQIVSISITSLNGQELLVRQQYPAFSDQAIDVSSLEGGIYIVSADSENGDRKSRKLVVY